MPTKRKATSTALIPIERIEQRIYLIRGQKVILSHDLARLYGVPAKARNQAVARNIDRFPADFMFQLHGEEVEASRSQIVTLKGRGQNIKYRPYAFTEEGVAMLSAVLRSATAVRVSIQIMRAFVRLRQLLASNGQLRPRLDELERTLLDHDEKFAAVFEAIRELMEEPPGKEKPPVGYQTEAKRGGAPKARATTTKR